MRILAVEPGPNFSVQDVHAGWVGALRSLGVDVADLNLADRLDFYCTHIADKAEAVRLTNNSVHAACYTYRPDVLLVTSCLFLTRQHLQVVRASGTRIVILHTESPYEDDVQLQRAAIADVNIVNDPTNLDRFRAVAPTWYLPHAHNPTVHRPRAARPDLVSDFAFAGTGYPSRMAFFEAVDWSGVDVALAGYWQALAEGSPLRKFVTHDLADCLDNAQVGDLYAATRVSANLYRREAHAPDLVYGWSMGPREVELAAMGVFFLRDPRGEGDEVLPMLPTFAGPADFGDKLRWWLAHDEQRAAAAEAARAAVADRTFEHNARALLALLDKEE